MRIILIKLQVHSAVFTLRESYRMTNSKGFSQSTRRHFLAGVASLSLTSCLVFLGLASPLATAKAKELTLYTARHYSSDDALYAEFTRKTGIRVNVISAGDQPLIERLKSEGPASPADVLLLADAARLWAADQEGLFQPLGSKALEKAIPSDLRTTNWVGLTTRARVLVIDPKRIKASDVQSYSDLARPEMKGLVCTRSGSHPYMLSLFGSLLVTQGPEKTEAWMKSVVSNLARPPKGGDTDQIRAVASGECGVAVSNSYYYARLMRSTKPADQEAIAKTQLIWPNQKMAGTHINISGGGIVKTAPNPTNGRAFLEFLASKETQAAFAEGNNEWPVVKGVVTNNPALDKLGAFKADPMPVEKFAAQQRLAQQLVDKTGWK
jgi:iron(III) transport system substrate-binding protein